MVCVVGPLLQDVFASPLTLRSSVASRTISQSLVIGGREQDDNSDTIVSHSDSQMLKAGGSMAVRANNTKIFLDMFAKICFRKPSI
jgi:hypothetical protein